MRNIYIGFGLIVVGLFMWACSDNDTSGDIEYAVFVENTLNIPYTAGEALVLVEWSATSWEISMNEDQGVIAKISQDKGGGMDSERQYTQIKLDYNSNPNKESRTQELQLKDLNTGEISKLSIRQSSKYDTYSFLSYYVSESGSDNADGSQSCPFRTIAQAATVTQPGDTVYIGGGTYEEHSIRPAVSGAMDAMIVFRPAGSGTVTLKHPGTVVSDNTAVFDLIDRNYIRIEGLQFSDFEYGKASIYMNRAMGNVIINNRFDNLGNAEISAWDATSVIFLYYSSRNVIRNNYFNKITGDAICVNDSSGDNLITENSFNDFSGKPRAWDTGGYSYTSGITCQETKTGDNIFTLNYGTKLSNLMWFDRNGSDNIVLRNVCHDSNTLLFNESRCARNVVQENIAYNLKGTAYETARYDGTSDTFDARWINNVSYNTRYGYYVDKSHRDEFRNNIIVNSSDYNLALTTRASDYGPRIFENNLWYSANKVNSIQYKGTAMSVASFGQTIGEVNTLSSDPLFLDPSQGDFRLQESSPAKGAGTQGIDLGAFAVYGKTDVGYDENMLLTEEAEVQFNATISTAMRGGSINIMLTLNKLAGKPVSVEIKPMAGDARQNVDFSPGSQTVEFGTGEVRKTISIAFQGTAEHDQLIAFRLGNAVNAQVGPKNMHVVRVKKN